MGDFFAAVARAVVNIAVALGAILSGAGPAPSQSAPTHPVPLPFQSTSIPGSASARILVHFKTSTTVAAIDAMRRNANAAERASIPQLAVRVFAVPDVGAALSTLRASAAVDYAEPDTLLTPTDTLPNDPYFPTGSGSLLGGEWGSFKTQAPKAWDITKGSSTVIIADIDSGVAVGLPDLAGQLVQGYNVLNGTTDTTDTYGHGTYVAGVISGAANNGIGIAGYCWSCRLMPVKVYSSSSAYVSDVATGVAWAVDHGARVLNISLAGSSSSTTLANAVTYARQHGAVVVAAAGNSGCNCPTYPASITGVVGVAASDQSDVLYSYSNYGSWVDLAAPGQNITTWIDGSYLPVGGTSMAAPVVAGIAGLLFSASLSATPDLVEQALFASVDPLAGTNGVARGRVNAYKALIALGTPAPSASPTLTPSPAPTATPTPAPAPTASPSPSPLPTPTPATLSSTVLLSGAITNKNTSRSFGITSAVGEANATLTFSKFSPLTLTVYGPDGVVLLSQSGASPLQLTLALPGGTSQFVVSGNAQSSFTLSVTYTTP